MSDNLKGYLGTAAVVLVVLVILQKAPLPASIKALFGYGPNC